jgi:hypothetical protein
VTSLRIIYDVDGWAYHHQARAMQKYAPPDFEVSIAALELAARMRCRCALGDEPADVVFLLREFSTPRARGRAPPPRLADQAGGRLELRISAPTG